MRRQHVLIAAMSMLLCLAVNSAALAADTVIYRLQDPSLYQKGCFDPCDCPIMVEVPVRGTFGLTLVEEGPPFDTYEVSQVNWTVALDGQPDPTGDNERHITGSGKYTIGGEFAALHRLELDLSTDGGPSEHFDSGWVVGGTEFPAIVIAISINGFYCYDTGIWITAKPVPKKEIVNYTLKDDSTFQQGCFPPCLCPITNEMPLSGTFALVPILDFGTVRELAVVSVEWKVEDGGIKITGAGSYTHIDGFAGPIDQLELDLSINGGNLRHFDSGLVNSSVNFPEIDSTVSMNGMVCFDIVMRVHATPTW
ncbi:MAG: hypothetical protein L0Y44_03140 [Phycisphaerales bacterium]|nr:hypothetical protein [Phycisphaerales bacterium]MCI0629632.1 hypothetical protein [Phycisphaerales bacterium]MCI0676207.1 hypothetical protein [Phycisphaerales bacterium]